MDETEPAAGIATSAAHFAATHWSAVVRAGGLEAENAGALEELCQTYWFPLYAFARRRGGSPADAEDLTQAFFARFLEHNDIARADPAKGRFRTFLLTLFKRFLANEWNRAHAQKRGGFRQVVRIDSAMGESRVATEPAHPEQPDILFERHWAMTLLDAAMKRLAHEYTGSGRGRLFEHLEGCLVRDPEALPYAEIALRLNLSEAAVKMAMQRLRARYQVILREEIGKTVASPEEIEPELRHLFDAFRAY